MFLMFLIRHKPTEEDSRWLIDVHVPPSAADTPERVIKIVDAAAALGYIFTIVTPTTQTPTLQIYFVPLPVLQSKIIALVYLGLNQDVKDVPHMGYAQCTFLDCSRLLSYRGRHIPEPAQALQSVKRYSMPAVKCWTSAEKALF